MHNFKFFIKLFKNALQLWRAFFFTYLQINDMRYTNLNDAKEHLKIEAEFTEDDNYIISLLNVSELAVSNYCNDNFSGYTVTDLSGNTSTVMPETIVQAVYILMSNFYTNRQPVSFAQGYAIPYTFDFLLAPYMNYTIV